MNKKFTFITVALILLPSLLFSQGLQEQMNSQSERTVTVYAYDSFVSDWGPGAAIVEGFEEKTGVKVNLVGCGGSGEMIARLQLESSNPVADVAVGIPSSNADAVSGLFDELTVFDYGYFAFMYDSESDVRKPTTLAELADPYYKDRIILIDPRTSSVGLGLLEWTYAAFGADGAMDWWKNAGDNALTIADSWSSGYGLFTEGEAPLCISYTTSPVYHVLYEDTTRYEALIFSEGHVETEELAGILSSSTHKDEAELFMDYLMNEAQADIAIANTMYPANEATVLPDAYDYAPKPDKVLDFDFAVTDDILSLWTETMTAR